MAAPATGVSARPWVGWPVLVVASAVVVYALPGASGVLVYDRAAILDGEVWRLVTGHWVHFSASHLCYDAVVLGVTGWLIRSRGDRYFPVLCLLAAVSIGMVLLVVVPGMARYGGLSGIAMASTVYLALQALHEPNPWRGAAVAVLSVCIGKMVLEGWTGHFALVEADPGRIVPAPASHLVGAASGVAVYLWARMSRPGSSMQPAEAANEARSIIDLDRERGIEALFGGDS